MNRTSPWSRSTSIKPCMSAACSWMAPKLGPRHRLFLRSLGRQARQKPPRYSLPSTEFPATREFRSVKVKLTNHLSPPSMPYAERFSFSRRVTRRLRVISAACVVLFALMGIAIWLWSVATYQRAVAEDRFCARVCVANGERLLSLGDLPGKHYSGLLIPFRCIPRMRGSIARELQQLATSFPASSAFCPTRSW